MLKVNRLGTMYIEIDGVITEKCCAGCGEIKVMAHFYNLKTGLGGKVSRCKICFAKYAKKYSELNPGYAKRFDGENGELKKAADKEYYEKNKERISERKKLSYKEIVELRESIETREEKT